MTRLPLVVTLLAALCLLVLSAWTPVHAAPPMQTPTFPAAGEVTTNANLRAGPGTTYAKVGSAKAGEVVQVVGCNDDCTWYQLKSEQWIAASLVELTVSSPAAAPTARPTASGSAKPTTSSEANVRSGPGQQYTVVGTAAAGQVLDLTGRNADSSWYMLRDGTWISATLVKNAPRNLPVQAAAAASGIGMTRAEMQAVYELLGFRFESSPLLDGRPRVIADRNTTIVELIGPPQEVQSASVIAVVPADDPDEVSNIIVYIVLLPSTVLPGWDSATWLVAQMDKADADADGSYKGSIVVDDKLVTLSVEYSIGTMLLTIEPAP